MPNPQGTLQDSPVADAVERVLRDFADPRAIVREPNEAWKPKLWQALADLGLPAVWASEARGGLGLALGEGLGIATVLGRHAIAVPVAEAMIANWILGFADVQAPEGQLVPAVVSRLAGGTAARGAWRSGPTAFAPEARHLVLVRDDEAGCQVALVPADAVELLGVESVSRDQRAIVSAPIDGVRWQPAPGLRARHVRLLGATMRSLQIAGALETVLALTLEYAQQRVAFGKTISKFQAVQQRMAQLGGETAAAIAAAQSAADCIASAPDLSGDDVLLEVAAGKIRCGEAAEAACAIAHQVHGAIGFTAEHALHRYTLRALAWRDDFGDEVSWAQALGRLLVADRATPLWHVLASR